MKDNDVAQISEQFGLDQEIVKQSAEDGTLGARIKDVLNGKVIYSKDDFDTFKKNYAAEITDSYFSDLVEKAKQGDVPQDLYKPIKGASYQQLERTLSKKYGIEDFSDVEDLIEKVKSSASGNTDESQRLIEELRQANTKLQEEKENAISTVREEFKFKMLSRDTESLLNEIPFDTDDPKRTQSLLKGVFNGEYKLDYQDDKLVVLKGDEVVKDEATRAPVSPKSVMIKLATDYGLKLKSPDTGGQGGNSSRHSTGSYESVEQFKADMESKGISTTDPEYYKAYKQSGLGNIK